MEQVLLHGRGAGAVNQATRSSLLWRPVARSLVYPPPSALRLQSSHCSHPFLPPRLVGNLARATYQKSTLGVWPWSYDKCGDVEYLQFKQQINACDGNPGYGLHPFQGRGAPEIDIFEVMPGHEMPGSSEPIRPFISQSLQVSPGIPREMNRPVNGDKLNRSVSQWYTDVTMSPGGEFNDGFWGAEAGGEYDPTKQQIHKYMEDAISVNTYLEESHFESHHVYRLEWQPGEDGRLAWYIDDKFYMAIGGQSMHDLTGAKVGGMRTWTSTMTKVPL